MKYVGVERCRRPDWGSIPHHSIKSMKIYQRAWQIFMRKIRTKDTWTQKEIRRLMMVCYIKALREVKPPYKNELGRTYTRPRGR